MKQVVLELKNITKSFDETGVLKGVNLAVHQGEFITILGASGCGKTTMLRLIAGLDTPEEGQILLEGQDVTDLAPDKRDVNTVFQNYALFPHMDVAGNVGYGLRLKKMPKQQIKEKTREVLELVQLSGYEKRKPSELSGGQKQRVAIARAIINNPKILLLDEPLGALDLQLRRAMQIELKKLQEKLGLTFIYITHDQEEAINMSDRIAVMNKGVLEQIGTPDEVYHHPKTSYVATFVGNANILKGTVSSCTPAENVPERSDYKQLVHVKIGEHEISVAGADFYEPQKQVTLAVRSENILILPAEERKNVLSGIIREKSFAGGQLRMAVYLPETGDTLIASRYGIDADVVIDEAVSVFWDPVHAVIVDEE
ncbi:MAG: ABC transporter ATP-binding protein [Lachnospiraceae bacterium]|jgi:spermidine/putrescine transport system ATP-binding protein